mmetsp:Transcript_95972/g.184363  ORF Transcript_95972/g.184363 Transcript_95972/m.184363 type:complete len:91 (-) Transcript_95972:67-339(-)
MAFFRSLFCAVLALSVMQQAKGITSAKQLQLHSHLQSSIKGNVDHHPNKEEACDTCKQYYPDATCYYGKCSSDDDDYCWCTQSTSGYTAC